ncbi:MULTISPECIES: hypothetical protein [Mycolicibacterium]|nr:MULTISPECIES: hypothetical protein [Mycolicibacterium]MCV6980686.1 hypothetical protein [Mycolicibacterium pulveris]MCV7222155.1 hypothetical protein [Mycolicibacterium elephantis]
MSTNIHRPLTATLGATVLTVVLAGQMLTAPTAHGDRTVSAQEICSQEGRVAKVRWFPPPVVGYCAHPWSILPGNSLDAGEGPISIRVPEGSYMVNPLDPLSPWVIPG